jgi:hypothetical protein
MSRIGTTRAAVFFDENPQFFSSQFRSPKIANSVNAKLDPMALLDYPLDAATRIAINQ